MDGDDGTERGNARGTVRAVSRAIAVLRAFRPDRASLALAEVAGAAHLDRATTRRMLVTLIDEGLVRQEPVGQRYGLTLRVLELAAAAPTGGLREEARPVMRRLAKATGVTVFLSVAGERGALCLERIDGDHPVQVKWWAVGTYMPWNCGAGPRLLLAHMPGEAAVAALHQAEPLNAFSATDPASLTQHFAAVRARGYEVTIDDVAVGLSAVAVPITNEAGIVAALSIGGLTGRLLDGAGEPLHKAALADAVREIGAHLPSHFTC